MFDDNLKSAFDKISPTIEQKRKMSKVILASKKKEKIHMMRYVGVLSSCAAVLLIAVSIYSINSFLKFKEQTAEEMTLIDNTVANDTEIVKKDELVTDKNKPEKQPEKSQQQDSYNTQKTRKIISDKNYAAEEKHDKIQSSTFDNVIHSDISVVSEEYNEKDSSVEFDSKSDSVFLYNDFSLFQEPVAKAAAKTEQAVSGGGAAFGKKETSVKTDDIISDNLVNAKETQFVESIKLPDDLSEENGNIGDTNLDNNRVYTYNGDEGRSFTITVSEDSQDYDKFASNDDINKTVISDSTVIVFSDEGVYGGYFTKDGYQYKVFSNQLSESEFEDAITSIVE